VSRTALVPFQLRERPFRGRDAVRQGLLTNRQLERTTWRRLFPGIYVHGEVEVDHLIRCQAAGLFLDGRGVVSGLSAALVWGVEVFPPGVMDPPVEVTVPEHTRLRTKGLVVVRSRLEVGDTARAKGVPVTTTVRTCFDIGRRLKLSQGVVALDAMLHKGLVSTRDLHHLLDTIAGWPGAGRLTTALKLVEPKAESPMESRLRLILVAGRLPRPRAQYEVFTRHGRFVARLDLAYPECHLGLEYEGDHHRSREVFQRDLRRINALRAEGWAVLRFGPGDVLRRPRLVLEQVRRELRGRRSAATAPV